LRPIYGPFLVFIDFLRELGLISGVFSHFSVIVNSTMLLTNTTSNYYYVGGYPLPPSGSVTIPDATYNNNDPIANQIHGLDDANAVTVSSAPSGYPRTISSGGGSSFSGSAADVTFSPAGTISATDVQAAIQEAAAEYPTTSVFVGVRAVRSTAQSISASSFQSVQFNAADTYDTNSFHDTSTNNTRITIPSGKAGYYLIAAEASFDLNTNGTRGVQILLNNTTAIGTVLIPPGPGFGTTLHAHAVYLLSVGDFIELQVFQSTSGSLNCANAWFSASLLGT